MRSCEKAVWLCEREAVGEKTHGVPAVQQADIIANGLVATWRKPLGESIVWSKLEAARPEAVRTRGCAATGL